MYTAYPPLICSERTVLQMENVSDHSAVDIVANPISAGSFCLPAPPFLFEQWTGPSTPGTPADSYRPQVNAEAGSPISCGATALTALHLLTQILRWSPFVNTARFYPKYRCS
jgi:hypothetical protein